MLKGEDFLWGEEYCFKINQSGLVWGKYQKTIREKEEKLSGRILDLFLTYSGLNSTDPYRLMYLNVQLEECIVGIG